MEPLNQTPESQQPIQSNNMLPIDVAELKKEPKNIGPIIGTFVIILLLVITAIYLLASRVSKEPTIQNTTTTTENNIPTQTITPIENNSDDLQSIQSDLDISIQGVDDQNF